VICQRIPDLSQRFFSALGRTVLESPPEFDWVVGHIYPGDMPCHADSFEAMRRLAQARKKGLTLYSSTASTLIDHHSPDDRSSA
jgi:hypothetical protein